MLTPDVARASQFRRQDLMAEAARVRLVDQARPVQAAGGRRRQVTAVPLLEAARASARSALASLATVALGSNKT